MVIAQVICTFVFAYSKNRFSCDVAQFSSELESVLETFERQEEVKEDLTSQLNQQEEEDDILSIVETMKDSIRTHLL